MVERVPVPPDGSDAALAHAIELARRYDATLDVLYVVDRTALPPDDRDRPDEGVRPRDGRRCGRPGARESAVHVTAAVTTGLPHREILGRAADDEADVIVMGTHGRRVSTGISWEASPGRWSDWPSAPC